MELYHKTLRSAGVVVAAILLFDAGFLGLTAQQFSDATQQHLAAVVGMTAGVEPTELNQMTAELTARQRELDQREAAIAAREIDARARGTSGGANDISTYILSSILFILLVLIVLNYVLDWVRARRTTAFS